MELQKVCGVTDAKIAATAQDLTIQLSTLMPQSKKQTVRPQSAELQELKSEVRNVKIRNVQPVENVKLSGRVESGAVQGELQNLKLEVYQERISKSQEQSSFQENAE